MWLVYALGQTFFLALVNYIDEYLTSHNKVPEAAGIHARIGGLVLVSTLLTSVGALAIWLITESIRLPSEALLWAFFSAVPLAVVWIGYFYLLLKYSPHQVVPLFLMSSLWLLLVEIWLGEQITLAGLCGIVTLLVGAYLLDTGELRWRIPTKLLITSVPITVAWAITVIMVRIAADSQSAVAVSFWQLLGMASIGIALLLCVKPYRDGLLFRIRHQGKTFLGLSLINEAVGQLGYVSGNLAIAIAPVAAYVSSLAGVQSLFLLVLFLLFPLHKERNRISLVQVVAILLIGAGIFLIER